MAQVLVIEDNEEQIAAAQKALVALGHEVTVARNYAEANGYLQISPYPNVERKPAPRPHMVLTDMNFPFHEGDEPSPCGMTIVLFCMKWSLPCMVLTSGHHALDQLWAEMAFKYVVHDIRYWDDMDSGIKPWGEAAKAILDDMLKG